MTMDDIVSVSIKPLYGAARDLIMCLTVDPLTSTLLAAEPTGKTVRTKISLGLIKMFCLNSQLQMGFYVKGDFSPGSHYVQTQVHEKNALTLTSSQMLGISSKLIDPGIQEQFVSIISYEVTQQKFLRYPKESRGKCDPGLTNLNLE